MDSPCAKPTCFNQNSLQRYAANNLEAFLRAHSRTIKTDVKAHLEELLGRLLRSGEGVDTATNLVVGIHLGKHLNEIIITSSLVEEEREVDSPYDFKLFTEVLVLTLAGKQDIITIHTSLSQK